MSKGGGKIEAIIGPMFSGKSTELLRLMRRYKMHMRVTVVKPRIDIRYDDIRVSTHDNVRADARVLERLADATEFADGFDVLLVDEGQFFEDLAEAALALCRLGKIVVVAALNGDFLQRPFDTVSKLIAVTDKLVFLTAICSCGRRAPHSARIGAQENDAVVQIGGAEMYQARCKLCIPEQKKPD